MSKIKFNKSNIENLKPTEIRYKVYTDECRGLYVEVYPSGHKTYRVRYKINQRGFHYQIGVYRVLFKPLLFILIKNKINYK